MGVFDKISKLIFEEEQANNGEDKKTKSTPVKKKSWTDAFFEDVSEDDSKKKRKSFLDVFFEDTSEDSSKEDSEKKKKSFLDIFFEENSDDSIKTTFVVEDEKTSVLDDIPSQIESRGSELENLAEFFRTVNPNDYPDSAPEYEAYLTLLKQLNKIKDLLKSNKSSTLNLKNDYQIEGEFKKFELGYQANIKSIQSLCYLSEIAKLNDEMEKMFHSNFTVQIESRITQIENYITLINQRSNDFVKKYSSRLFKELIEAEYRITLLKLMSQLNNGENHRKNPFNSFSDQKKKIFQTYISKDIRTSNTKYNSVADSREKYIKYKLVREELFDEIDTDAEIIAESVNKYTIDDFLLNELFDNGEGFETLKRFLKFQLVLNFIDSKTDEADKRVLDESYRRVTNKKTEKRGVSTSGYNSKCGRKFPNYDDDL